MELPLFPLNTVLFPGGVLPLRIFETRYIDMVRHCLRSDAPFGVILIREGAQTGASSAIHGVGTWGQIVDWEQRPDGLLGITIQGEMRFRVERTWVQKDGLLLGEVIEHPMPADDVALPGEFLPLADLLQRLLQALPPPYCDMVGSFDRCGWVGARLTELMPFDPAQKQALLEMDDALARLFHLRDALVAAG
ncbi:hypothetical protein SAMN05421693_13016 [Ectothiorhodospira magna]|uniref:Lon N-terminal domain-containing protein n=1 Tax=Ectothiorhodospira magna TaxID=867345 RepID=A0A1H9FVQ8_9GAMM|nr:LON peptidase substrate-binding domain-containing protein [Ectothiorhodospira magna]SEQ42001.1 hypothetical protein SAMN05421693_13016 [Ectothiorhodospira magna]